MQETGRSDSAYPVLFLRTPSSQTGHLQPLVKSKVTEKFDYEGELALIIGKPGRHIASGDALSHVAGYACYNDGTAATGSATPTSSPPARTSTRPAPSAPG